MLRGFSDSQLHHNGWRTVFWCVSCLTLSCITVFAVCLECFILAWLFQPLYFCVLAYLEEIQSVRRHTNSSSDPKNTNLPVLVHCSAGVGRTGVVILSEIMIACLEHNEVHMSCACSGMSAFHQIFRKMLTVTRVNYVHCLPLAWGQTEMLLFCFSLQTRGC